jgi:phage replication O-like protein O
MANPQKEYGFTAIANELVEAFQRVHLSGNQWQILWAIMRLTYGWNKKVAFISLTIFEKHTGLDRRNLKRDLDAMVKREIISKDSSNYITKYGIQKDYSKWQTGVNNNTGVKNNTSVNNNTTTSVENNTETSVDIYTHKRKKEKKDIYMCHFKEFWEVYPTRNGRKLGKGEAQKFFSKIKAADYENVVQAAKYYSNSEDVQKGIGIRDPKRFIKNNYWKEWVDARTATRRFDEISH